MTVSICAQVLSSHCVYDAIGDIEDRSSFGAGALIAVGHRVLPMLPIWGELREQSIAFLEGHWVEVAEVLTRPSTLAELRDEIYRASLDSRRPVEWVYSVLEELHRECKLAIESHKNNPEMMAIVSIG